MAPIAPRLIAFVLLLAGVFAAAAFAGSRSGVERAGDDAPAESMGEHGGGDEAGADADPVRGLAVAENGVRLELLTPSARRGEQTDLRFRVVGSDGAPVRDFDVEHERRMHVIVVRRDMAGFQHLHPAMAADGTWSVPVTLPEAGTYRVFADFSADGERSTLGADLTVAGAAATPARPLPAPARTATAGGYRVALSSPPVRAGEEAELRFAVTRGGKPVQVQPYLGALGHLVALRDGDLAFLHVHPEEGELAFMTTFPTEGRYRLFLQFRAEGKVHTAEFTQEVSR